MLTIIIINSLSKDGHLSDLHVGLHGIFTELHGVPCFYVFV